MADALFRVLMNQVKRLVDMRDGTHAEQVLSHPPFDLLTDGGDGPNRRLRVDSGQTGFFARRMWRVSYEFTGLAATPIVLKVVVPVNFIIHHQDLVVDTGGVVLKAYRSTQGVEGGTFAVAVPIISDNFMTEASEYTFQGSIVTGGTFTPSATAVETIRVRAANATAQSTTVSGGTSGERGLAAGTYYLVMANLSGVTGSSSGVYSLIVEERP